MARAHYYFATHQTNNSIYERLRANRDYELLTKEEQEVYLGFKNFYNRKSDDSLRDQARMYVEAHKDVLTNKLTSIGGDKVISSLTYLLGYNLGWGAAAKGFGKNSVKRADKILETDLIKEMTTLKSSLWGLLDAANYDLAAVKPYLPAIMASLDANTRDASIMRFRHTGIIVLDFDGFESEEDALYWLNKFWDGTENVKPYLLFLSPRRKGFKALCQVDTSDPEFQNLFKGEVRDEVITHHKNWFSGIKMEVIEEYPELESHFDDATSDVQRLTYIPFIDKAAERLKYDPTRYSTFYPVYAKYKDYARKELEGKMEKVDNQLKSIMQEQGIGTREEAYRVYQLRQVADFDPEYEWEKFSATIDFIVEEMARDARVMSAIYEVFDSYSDMFSVYWALYGCFGEKAQEKLMQLLPPGSPRLDSNNNDFRWTAVDDDSFGDERRNIGPGAFYIRAFKVGIVKEFVQVNYFGSSKDRKDLDLIEDAYKKYEKNLSLLENEDDRADASEFLDSITKFLDKEELRDLPMITELQNSSSQIKLGPSEYLDGRDMKYLLREKYKDKRIFHLRAQCGTGKNSISADPLYKIEGKVLLAEP